MGLADPAQRQSRRNDVPEHGAFVTGGMSFAALKAQSLINARAKAADASSDFSQLIRVGLPTPKPGVAR